MYLSTKGDNMNSLNTLIKILEVVTHADREMSIDTPLHQVKALFDSLQLDNVIDFDSQYGQIIRVVLHAKRKNIAMKNLIFARSILQTMIKEVELENLKQDEIQKKQDSLAIESTCVTVTDNEKDTCSNAIAFDFKEVQLQLNDIPKKIGRPKSSNSLSGAERAKRARDKKKANKLTTVNTTLTMHASMLYKQMIDSGYDLNSIIEMAHNQAPLGDKAC
jgi:hypothetical protein